MVAVTDKVTNFTVGSKIVYPSHGLGTIEKIEDQCTDGVTESYYVISFRASGMTIMSPVNAAKFVGLRSIIPKKDVSKIVEIMKNGKVERIEPNWNKRQKTYLEKIKSGSVFEVSTVYRDLHILKEKKGLSFGEQQVFDNAHKLVVSEIAEAKGIDEDKASLILQKALTEG